MRTILIVTLEHSKPLPDKVPITDITADRIQNYLYANNCEATVTATRLTEHERPLNRWEIERGQPS